MKTSVTDCRSMCIAARAILLCMVLVWPAWAQEAEPDAGMDATTLPETSAVIAPEAQAVLDRMTATFATIKSYAVTAQITRDEMLSFGYKLQHHESARMWVETPNRLRLEVEGDIKNRTYVYDGSQLTIFAPDQMSTR